MAGDAARGARAANAGSAAPASAIGAIVDIAGTHEALASVSAASAGPRAAVCLIFR